MLTPINNMLSRSHPVAQGQLPVQTPQQILEQVEQYKTLADGHTKIGQVDEAEKLYQAAQKLFEEEVEKLSLDPQSVKIIESIYLSYGLLLNEQGRRTEAETLEQKRQQLFERYRLISAGFSKKQTVESGSSSLHLNKKNHPVAIERLAGADASLFSYPNAKLEALQDSSVLTDSAGTDYVGVETLVQSCHGTINAPVHGKNNTVNVHYYPPNLEAKQPHAVSLDSLRNALYQHYKLSNLSIQRVSGGTASLKDCYINLAIVESQAQREEDKKELKKQAVAFERLPSSEWQQLESTNSNKLIALEKLFEAQKLRDGSEGVPKRILIQGRAGIGKTTLCKKLVYEYHHNGLWQDRFESLLWVPLRQLKAHSPKRLEDLLCNQYFAGHLSRQALALAEVFYAHQDKTLFILDGLDEVVGELDEGRPLKEFLQILLNQAHVVITSRPAGVDTQLLGELDLELETVGFSKENVQEYIEKFAPEPNQTAIQQFIDRTPLIQGLVNIPIQLDALCYSWDSLPKDQETITMAMLYEAMVNKLWRKDGDRLEKEAKGRVLGASIIQTLPNAKLEKLMNGEMQYLSYLAFKGLEKGKIEFSFAELNKRQEEFEAQMPPGEELPYSFSSDLKKTSYLHTADAKRPEAERHYHFLHLTFQEFFAAKFLVRHLQAESKIAKTDLGLILSQEMLQKFIAEHKYNPRYEIVWWLVAGLLKGAALEAFFALLEKSPRDLIGIRHQQVIMGCLNEAHTQLDKPIIDRLEAELMQWLQFEMRFSEYGESKLGCQRAFPEHLLLTSLRQNEVEKKKIIRTLGARSVLSEASVQALVGALQDQDRAARTAAAHALENQKTLSEASIQDLVSALQHKNGMVRSVIAIALGGQITQSEAVAKALNSALQDQERAVRSAAVRALGSQATLPQSSVQALIDVLQDQDKYVRDAAARALENQKTLSGATVQVLIDALQHKNEYVKSAAVRALGGQATLSEAAIQALIGACQDQDEDVRSAAVRALGGQSSLSEAAIQALIGACQDQDEDVRSAAAHALGEGQITLSEAAVPALIHACQDQDEDARDAAARVLGGGQITLSEAAVPALIHACQDQDEDARDAAARVLEEGQITLSEAAVQALIRAFQDQEWNVRFAAVRALGSQSPLSEAAVHALIGACQDESVYVRYAAAGALGGQSALSETAVHALIGACQDQEWNVRSAAARALGSQSPFSETVVQALIGALRNQDEDVEPETTGALKLNIDQLYTVLPALEAKQIQMLYREVLFGYSCAHIAPLYVQGNQLHFYTKTGPGHTEGIKAEKMEKIIQAFEAVQIKEGLKPVRKEALLVKEA